MLIHAVRRAHRGNWTSGLSVALNMAYFPFAQIETLSPCPQLLIAAEKAQRCL